MAKVFDLLDLLEAMSAHFHEHHEAIMRWSWKLFCAKWVRLIKFAAEEKARKQQREREDEMRRLGNEHAARWGRR